MESSIPCGIANLGNTCFLNSCIQILNCIDELKHSRFSITRRDENEDTLVASEFFHLCSAMNESRGDHRREAFVINPERFVRMIHRVAARKGRELFTGWAQNDLHEFLLFMIECMHNSKKRSIKIQLNGNVVNETDRLALQCYSVLKESYERGDYSEFVELVQGVYVSRLSTPNGEKLHSIRPEIYSILDLPIPMNSERVNLYNCFDAFIADELLVDWENEQTREKELVRKNAIFWNFPQILIIALKRYSPDGRYKNNVFVDFPLEDLDLSKYVIGYKPASFKYDLFGVANHMGGVNGGHYTAFARSTMDNRWFCYNDSAVTGMSESQVVSPTAYCLFYRKLQ